MGGGGGFAYRDPPTGGVQMNQGRRNLRYDDNDEAEVDLDKV